jgi:hypothetical protein
MAAAERGGSAIAAALRERFGANFTVPQPGSSVTIDALSGRSREARRGAQPLRTLHCRWSDL